MSPPYLSREELKHTEMTLSLACITKLAAPSATQGSTSFAPGKRFSARSVSIVFLPRRKASTHTQDRHWDITVASAAPRTPMPRAKMNTGSSTIFVTAPMSTVYMPTLAKPCAVMNAFMPSVSCTNTVPSA